MINEFFTEGDLSVPAVTDEQMREIDRIATEETGPNLLQMMENAGRSLAELTIEVLGENWRDQKILILAGTGGNGGGGICAARHLSNRGGNIILCISEPDKLKEVTAYQLHILSATSVKIISIKDLEAEFPDLIIDAIIGYSLSGEPTGNALKMIKWLTNQSGIKISLDVPSGVNATTGEAFKNFVKPDITLVTCFAKNRLTPITYRRTVP
jgi:NAD(P)H-hydrate epimerase